MMERISNQTSFVDTTDYGVIDKTSLHIEIEKYKSLQPASKEQLKKGLANINIWEWMFREILEGKRSFTDSQFIAFRSAILYYQDLEKYPNE